MDPILEHRPAIHMDRVTIMQGPAVEVPKIMRTSALKLGREHPYGVTRLQMPAQKREI